MPTDRHLDSRLRLARILGLPESAPDEDLRFAAARLLAVLRHRQQGAPASEDADDSEERRDADRALAEEIETLAASVERVAGKGTIERRARVDRQTLAGALLGTAIMLAVLVAYANGFRIIRLDGGAVASLEEPATLILVGQLPGATLRVLDADREELFIKTSAEGAVVELTEGRYALEVSREDCPDRWTRSVYFEAGATHRFEPSLCMGSGQLTIRSNVKDDRLVIDGFDVGATSAEPHTLSVGDHDVRVEKTGFLPFESRVRIGPDSDLELRAELATAKKGHGIGPGSPLALPTPLLSSKSLPTPEPFDLKDLKQEIAPRKVGSPRTRLLRREGAGGLPDGGSTAWHDRVSREIVTRFDGDDSGLIDRLEESEAISCPLWQEIEMDFERGGLGLSMARYYGFDGSEWHPGALGFARNMRSVAYEKMKECGLQI